MSSTLIVLEPDAPIEFACNDSFLALNNDRRKMDRKQGILCDTRYVVMYGMVCVWLVVLCIGVCFHMKYSPSSLTPDLDPLIPLADARPGPLDPGR